MIPPRLLQLDVLNELRFHCARLCLKKPPDEEVFEINLAKYFVSALIESQTRL